MKPPARAQLELYGTQPWPHSPSTHFPSAPASGLGTPPGGHPGAAHPISHQGAVLVALQEDRAGPVGTVEVTLQPPGWAPSAGPETRGLEHLFTQL